jgi:Mg-chelatase subunit ChlD
MANQSLARTQLERSLSANSLEDLVRVKTSEHAFLLLDCSSSMDEEMRNGKKRIDGLRDVVKEVQSRRQTQMVAFGPRHEDRTVFFCSRVPAPAGRTPLDEAITFAKDNGAGRIVVISDGWPNNPATAKEAATQFGGQVDVVFVGDPGDPGSTFLKELAEMTGGTEFDGDLSEPKKLGGAVIGLLNGAVDETEGL